MTVFVSASPIPSSSEVEVRAKHFLVSNVSYLRNMFDFLIFTNSHAKLPSSTKLLVKPALSPSAANTHASKIHNNTVLPSVLGHTTHSRLQEYLPGIRNRNVIWTWWGRGRSACQAAFGLYKALSRLKPSLTTPTLFDRAPWTTKFFRALPPPFPRSLLTKTTTPLFKTLFVSFRRHLPSRPLSLDQRRRAFYLL